MEIANHVGCVLLVLCQQGDGGKPKIPEGHSRDVRLKGRVKSSIFFNIIEREREREKKFGHLFDVR